ncbi:MULTISPECIES: murein hydrolase activator EnvC family protein [unclassified Blastococcus]
MPPRLLPALLLVAGLVAAVPAAAAPAPPAPAAGAPAAAAAAAPPAGGALWASPLPGAEVTRRFEAPASPYGPGHRGVDLAAGPGAAVLAVGDGVVAFAGSVAGRPVVSIDHPGGLRTTYEPVDPTVGAGQAVARGSPIGVLAPGHAGCPAAACLHWGLRRGETYLDPLLLLAPPRVRLLPPA